MGKEQELLDALRFIARGNHDSLESVRNYAAQAVVLALESQSPVEGEFICKKCGLRQDAPNQQPADF